MRTAKVYRINVLQAAGDHNKHNYLASDQVQFELVEFTDGSIAQRWTTRPKEERSTAFWNSIDHLKKVHCYPHPDYGTRIEWSDGEIEKL